MSGGTPCRGAADPRAAIRSPEIPIHMKLYRYLTGPDDTAFCKRVTAALNKGWSLAGDPTLTFDPVKGRGEEYSDDVVLSDY